MVVTDKDAPVQADDEKIVRKMLAHGGELMMCEVMFKKISDTPGMHKHEHEQISYVTKGKFEFFVEGRADGVLLEAGDSIYIEPNVMHGAMARTEGATLLDVFTPMRADFLMK